MSKGTYRTVSGEHPYYTDDFGSPVHKDAWDKDFKAGWAAASKLSDPANAGQAEAYRAYSKVMRKHGHTFLEGFKARVDKARGVNSKGVFYAKALGLGTSSGHEPGVWRQTSRDVFVKHDEKGNYVQVERDRRYRGGAWSASYFTAKGTSSWEIGVYATQRGAKVAATNELNRARRGPFAAGMDREHRKQSRLIDKMR